MPTMTDSQSNLTLARSLPRQSYLWIEVHGGE
jgi:hypothetical protein